MLAEINPGKIVFLFISKIGVKENSTTIKLAEWTPTIDVICIALSSNDNEWPNKFQGKPVSKILLEYSPTITPKAMAKQLCNLGPQKSAVRSQPGLDKRTRRRGRPKILKNFNPSSSNL